MKRWLREKSEPNHTQTWLAEQLGIGQQSVSNWKRGTARPEPELRDALERLIGIPRTDWYTADERAVARGHASVPPMRAAEPVRN